MLVAICLLSLLISIPGFVKRSGESFIKGLIPGYNIYLFLYNKYKLNFLSVPKYINMNGDKIYELIYKFTLI